MQKRWVVFLPSVVGFQCPTPSPPSSQLLPERRSQPGPQPCDSTSFLAHALFPRRCELPHLPFALYPTRRPLISPNSDASAGLSSPLIQKHQATCLARGPLSGTSPRPLRALLPRAPRHRRNPCFLGEAVGFAILRHASLLGFGAASLPVGSF